MAGGDAWTGAEGFEFAFDSEPFSDRLLRIQVVGGSDDALPASRKRRREQDDKGDDIPPSRVNTIHVNSAILASKSRFFFKLFSNGMKESGQREATVRIADSEETAFMELLRFMYTGKLTPTTEPTLLVHIWVAADKFEVASCMSICSQRLQNLPMTPQSAVLYLDLPSSIPVAADLTEAAKKYLSKRYKDFVSPKFQDELMRIPLAGIVAILSRSDLLAVSEVSVYDFVLRWAFTQYPGSEERCRILSSRLLPLVPRMQGMNKAVQTNEPSRKLNFFLKRERCSWLYQSRSVYPCQEFCFAGNVFYLSFHCNSGCFGLTLQMLQDKGPVKGTIDYKFQAKTRSLRRYVTMYECTSADSKGAVGCEDLFGIPWSEFIADDSPFFVDGILYLQIDLKLTRKPLHDMH